MRESRRRTVITLATACLLLVGCIGREFGPSAATPVPRASVASPSPSAAPTASADPSPSPSSPADDQSSPDPSIDVASMEGTAGPGCGTGQKGFFTHRDEIEHVLTLSGAPIELTTASVGLRNGTYAADDAIPGYLGLSADETAVKVAPRGKVVLAGKGMTLTGLTVGTVPWATVDFATDLPFTTATAKAAAWRLRADGSIAITAPAAPGDYMLDMTVLWQTECLKGDGTVYGRIVVR